MENKNVSTQNPRAAELSAEELRRMPFQFDQPVGMLPDLVVAPAVPEDERIWVPQAENVWFRPLCLNRSAGYWMNLLRVRKSGVLSRHRHPGPVHAFVIKGRWHYLEHDWEATEGSYAFERPGPGPRPGLRPRRRWLAALVSRRRGQQARGWPAAAAGLPAALRAQPHACRPSHFL